ncbi:MAG: exodeoxyribonuclease VII large subunit [Anaeroplasma sp.]
MEEQYLTVSALTKYIKYKFDHDCHLENVLLEGEISNFKHNARGHFYFTLKDDYAQISVTMFATYASKVKIKLVDGMKVYVKGTVTVYEPSGTYQINIREIKSDGLGDLYIAYEQLKQELSKEGLFDIAHKKDLPRFPKTIGVITSPTGAAIRDIINTISRRYPLCKVILYPAIVQGDTAKDDIVAQIMKANIDNLCDVLIVGRGGGSIEDLWAFNEKVVAYAIFNSNIPIISAVGHEIDFTIADYVADKRAATPTAAAELATPDIRVLKENINNYIDTLCNNMRIKVENYKMRLSNMDRQLELHSPLNILKNKRESLDKMKEGLNIRINHILEIKKYSFKVIQSKLESFNPLSIMDKGYSMSMINNKIVTNVDDVKVGNDLKTRLKDGYIISKVIEVNKNGK